MASTNTRLGLPFQLSAQLGQGTRPLVRCRVSFSDAAALTPIWTEKTDQLRDYSTSRGRNTELEQFDAGSATISFVNKDRSLDPNSNASVRPMNRVWLCEEFSGSMRDLFKGYAESWEQTYDPTGILDATTTVTAVDEFKVLTLSALPTTSPPRDSYADLIAFNNPDCYYPLNDDPATLIQVPEAIGSGGELPSPGPDRGLLPVFSANWRVARPAARWRRRL